MEKLLCSSLGTAGHGGETVDSAFSALSRISLLKYNILNQNAVTLPKLDTRQAKILNALGVSLACCAPYSMLMISFTIIIFSGTSRFNDEYVKKLCLMLNFDKRVLCQLLSDLFVYYASLNPFLLSMGVFRRILAPMYTNRQSNGYYLKMAWSRQKLALHLQLGRPSSKPIKIFGP